MTTPLKTLATATLTTLAMSTSALAGDFTTQRVSFKSQGETIVGRLYVPEGASASRKAAAVTIIGPMTFAKEQAPSLYAERLARAGYVALVFDPRFRAESGGATRFLESPTAKAADIQASITYLASLNQVDANRINGLGICQGSTAMLIAAQADGRLNAFATVAGHYLGGAANIAWLGEDGLKTRLERGRAARGVFERTGEVITVPAVDRTRTDVGMPGEFVWSWYQPWADRGVWENNYAVMSDAALLEVDTEQAAKSVTTPWLMVHSNNSFLPEFARARHQSATNAPRKLLWEGDTAHFQYYEDPAILDRTTKSLNDWFEAN